MSSSLDGVDGVLAVNQLASIIWSADDAIISKRLDGTITSWNRGAEQLFGYTADEMIGQSITRLLPPDRQGEEATIIAQLAQGKRISHFETARLCKDGALVDVSVSIAPILDGNGKVVGASTIARNIADVVAARAREARLRQFMRALVRASRATAKALDEASLFEEIARVCVELQGVKAALIVDADEQDLQLQGFASLRGIDVEALSQEPWLFEAVKQVMNSTADVSGARGKALQAPDGVAVAVLPFLRGPSVGGALVLVADRNVTFDRDIMGLLEELAADVSSAVNTRARAAEFESIVQSATDAIIAVDAGRRILRINPAACEMFLWPESEAIGQQIDRLIPERFRQGHAALMERFANQETMPRRMGPTRTLAGCRSDGTEFPIEATVSRFGKGAGLRMIVAIRDVSAQLEAEQAHLARRQAEAANRAKSEFLSFMSHELRTPLNAILGFAQVLLDEKLSQLEDSQRTQVRQIRTAGKHLHALISDLLDMGRIEVGKLTVHCRPLAIEDVLNEVLLLVEGMAESAALTFEAPRHLSHLPPVVADPTRLRQIFLNLISNAVKYNRPHGSVAIETHVADDAVTVCVRDTGVGMNEEQLSQLFVPYNRLGRESSRISGTGIGLVVTKSLVDLMNATLSFESTPGRGTCAYVTLPRAEGVVLEASLAESGQGALDADEVTGRVLSVEDNPVNQLLLEAVFQAWPKVELLQAMDGRSGLELVRQYVPDVVLLDMNLPDMDGFQFIRELAAEFPHQSIKVIILSATAEAEDIARATAKGVAAYLTKPIDLAAFKERLTAVLGNAH